jgi:putative flavoprotein involved in K+ transport
MSEERHEALVCGAGTAGLGAAAMLQKAGVETLALEAGEGVGSSWRARYDTLRLNTVGWMSGLPGYRATRRRYGEFPSRDAWVEYLEHYAQRSSVPIRFETKVERIDRGNGGWIVETSRGRLEAPFVVVATGYDREPFMPDWPGKDGFEGELIHAAQYTSTEPYRERDVLVVGPATTGVEVAYFVAKGGARRVRVASRTPPNIFPRKWLGLPLNMTALGLERLPPKLGDQIAYLTQRLIFGDLSKYGLPRSPQGILTTLAERGVAPAVDCGFVELLKTGRIEIVAAVDAFDGPDVLLSDGTRIQPEAVIAATGYRRGLEALVGHLPGVLDPRGQPAMAGGRENPAAPGLFFAGFVPVISGQLRQMRFEARRIARAVRKRSGAGRRAPLQRDVQTAPSGAEAALR